MYAKQQLGMSQVEKDLNRERERRRKLNLRESRRSHFWRAALVGILAGLSGVLFQYALVGAEYIRNTSSAWLHSRGLWGPVAMVLLCVFLSASAGWLTMRFAPEASGSGIPHVKAVLLHLRKLDWLRILAVKFVGGFLAIGAGLSLGREGPTVHIGSALGKALAEKLRIPKRSYRSLIACGAGAGLTAAFNAPLAGFLFVIEEMQRELTPTTYGTALIASVCSDAVTRLIIGQHSAFRITGYPAPPMQLLPLIAVLGALAGLLGVLFNKLLLMGVRLGQKWKWERVLFAGVVAGLVVWFVPAIAGGGHHTAEIVLSGSISTRGAIWLILLLMFGKLLFTVISYAAGVPGGIFAPMLVMGAFLGLAIGEICHVVAPALPVNSAAFAVLGMASLFAASVRAPITGIMLIVEMTSNYDQLYALIVACLAAYLVAEALHDLPVYEALLEEDLHRNVGNASGEPVLMEVYVEPGSPMDGQQVEELDLPEGHLVVSIMRGDNEFEPPDKFHIRGGDVVVFISENNEPHVTHSISKLARV
jgi:CIC family chloride channel protein